MVLLMVVCDIIPKPINTEKNKAIDKLAMCENKISAVPKINVLMNKIFFKFAPDLSEARKIVPQIAPSPIKLFRYPKVEALPSKIILAYTGSKVENGSTNKLIQASNKIT